MKSLVDFINEEITPRQLKHIEDTMKKQPNQKLSTGDFHKKLNWLPEGVARALMMGVRTGYIIDGNNNTFIPYGISRENIVKVFTKTGDFGKVEIEKAIDLIDKNNIPFKYETDDEWKGVTKHLNGKEIELQDPLK